MGMAFLIDSRTSGHSQYLCAFMHCEHQPRHKKYSILFLPMIELADNLLKMNEKNSMKKSRSYG